MADGEITDPMEDSILTSIKQSLGILEEVTAFDFELCMHINSTIATLNQLGVGPREGFAIRSAAAKWSDLLEHNTKLENVKCYIFMKVKVIFDSSNMSQHQLSAYTRMIDEETWRLVVANDPYVPQMLPIPDEGEV